MQSSQLESKRATSPIVTTTETSAIPSTTSIVKNRAPSPDIMPLVHKLTESSKKKTKHTGREVQHYPESHVLTRSRTDGQQTVERFRSRTISQSSLVSDFRQSVISDKELWKAHSRTVSHSVVSQSAQWSVSYSDAEVSRGSSSSGSGNEVRDNDLYTAALDAISEGNIKLLEYLLGPDFYTLSVSHENYLRTQRLGWGKDQSNYVFYEALANAFESYQKKCLLDASFDNYKSLIETLQKNVSKRKAEITAEATDLELEEDSETKSTDSVVSMDYSDDESLIRLFKKAEAQYRSALNELNAHGINAFLVKVAPIEEQLLKYSVKQPIINMTAEQRNEFHAQLDKILEQGKEKLVKQLTEGLQQEAEKLFKMPGNTLDKDTINKRFQIPFLEIYKKNLDQFANKFKKELLVYLGDETNLAQLTMKLKDKLRVFKGKYNQVIRNEKEAKEEYAKREQALFVAYLNEMKRFAESEQPRVSINRIIQSEIGYKPLDYMRDDIGNTLLHHAMVQYHQSSKSARKALLPIVELLIRRGSSCYTLNKIKWHDKNGLNVFEHAEYIAARKEATHVTRGGYELKRVDQDEQAKQNFPDFALLMLNLKYMPTCSEGEEKARTALLEYTTSKTNIWSDIKYFLHYLFDSNAEAIRNRRRSDTAEISEALDLSRRKLCDGFYITKILERSKRAVEEKVWGPLRGKTLFDELVKIATDKDLETLPTAIEEVQEDECANEFEDKSENKDSTSKIVVRSKIIENEAVPGLLETLNAKESDRISREREEKFCERERALLQREREAEERRVQEKRENERWVLQKREMEEKMAMMQRKFEEQFAALHAILGRHGLVTETKETPESGSSVVKLSIEPVAESEQLAVSLSCEQGSAMTSRDPVSVKSHAQGLFGEAARGQLPLSATSQDSPTKRLTG